MVLLYTTTTTTTTTFSTTQLGALSCHPRKLYARCLFPLAQQGQASIDTQQHKKYISIGTQYFAVLPPKNLTSH